MPFPNSERVLYSPNPLKEVICQVRFPRILQIDESTPSQFQEAIRTQYPLFEDQLPVQIAVGQNPSEDNGQDATHFSPNKQFNFSSSDNTWKVSLSGSFLALTTTAYCRWEEFELKFFEVLDLCLKQFHPPFFERIGLRYRDVIIRSELGLEDSPWADLLATHIAGIYNSPDIEESSLTHSVAQFTYALLGKNSAVRIHHGLARNPESQEEGYLIDTDFYQEGQIDVHETRGTLRGFNSYAGNAFRWCISERLHRAMHPKPVA